MGLFSWLTKSKRQLPLIRIDGPGKYAVDIVGESHYQDELDHICGGKCADGFNKEVEAMLILDDKNPYDDQAVAVSIDGELVGHLSRGLARQYRTQLLELEVPRANAIVQAKIVGGWIRDDGDEGHFGVKLDLPTS